ncbi:MAG: rhomboid family intramembrane serine protease [Actinomycetota bacterium]|nr:rhomboid family intramembrane serine protease [Actinomycetota bacterium]
MSSSPSSPGRRRLPALRERFDAGTWSGALAIMGLIVGLLWAIEILDSADGHHLDRFGLRPRRVDGLDGIVTMPFLHASAGHLLANTFPLLIIGWMVLISGLGAFLRSTAIIVVVGGILTWLIAPAGSVIVGASAVVFGWLGYLLARAYFARRLSWILAAAFALFFFSGLFSGLLPTVRADVSWQAHVCGFAAGVLSGYLLHPRKGSPRAVKRSAPGRRPS